MRTAGNRFAQSATPAPHPILAETALTLSQACRLLPGTRGCEHPDPATLTRWILNGIRVTSGCRVKLEAVKLPGGWRTSREAVSRFLAALTDGHQQPAVPLPSSPRRRSRSAEEADRKLREMGF